MDFVAGMLYIDARCRRSISEKEELTVIGREEVEVWSK